MITYIALLRSINLAGHNKVKMVELRELISELGFGDVRSVLQSGNFIFDSDAESPSQVEDVLKEAIEDRLGLKTALFVRTTKEWAVTVADNPFTDEANSDAAHLLVVFLKGAPDRKKVITLEKAIVGREHNHAKGRQLYIVYPDGIGRSRLTNSLIERKLETDGTARNWNTVLKVAALTA